MAKEYMSRWTPLSGWLLVVLAAVAWASSGCGDTFGVPLRVVDEDGAPIAGAQVWMGEDRLLTGPDGHVELQGLERPTLALIEAEGFLTEPAPLGRGDVAGVEVVLLRARGRVVLHSTGDVMMGRRYVTPTEGPALLTPGAYGPSARAVVSDVAPALAAADLVTVNLETVVGQLPTEVAYPGKRWLLQTPPEALEAFEPLGVDALVLANNHQRDWLEEGLASTLTELERRGLPHVGAGLSPEEASQPLIVEIEGLRIGVLAFTSVDGDYVNDQYPTAAQEPPADLPPEDSFKWEARWWGEPTLGIPEAWRRLGDAWQVIKAAEPSLGEGDQTRLWASATTTYPELQDWVARRGHGGGRRWGEDSPAAIAALRAQVDLVMVQLHMGFQFAQAPGEAVMEAARSAVDSGAALVVCHHPHVLQGFEWYRGRLIAYSLGNFLFDQDFLSTFQSGFLRTVWEGSRLVQARVVPLLLDRYRPVPLTGRRALGVGRTLWEGSLLPAVAKRGVDLGVRSVASPARAAPGMRYERSTWVLTEAPASPLSHTVSLGTGGVPTALPFPGLVRRRLNQAPPDDVWVGRSLSGLGDFEDEDADHEVGEVAGWTWSSEAVSVDRSQPLAGYASLSLLRRSHEVERVSARMIARVTLPEHRLYLDPDGQIPLDGSARWSVRLLAEREGRPATTSVRLALYHFDDLDPTEDPESTLLREVELWFEPPEQPTWQLLEIPEELMAPVQGKRPNAALLYVSLYPPAYGTSLLRVDEVEVIEWRPAAEEPDGYAALDWVCSSGATREVEVTWLPW